MPTTERIIDLSEEPARLSVNLTRLVIQRQDKDDITIPLDEVGVLIVSHRQVIYSHAVLAGLAQAGGAFVACDERHLPIGLLLPLVGHHTQSERFLQQAEASQPTRKRIWQQLITAKIREQGRLLQELHQNDHGLLEMATRVRSGDPDNLEGMAARRYWSVLFNDPAFRRDPEREGLNALLNYGYAVLRAMTARAICGAGLHPSLGVHHHNRYDAYCLADDLMEPFRPLIDRAAAHSALEHPQTEVQLDKAAKAALISAITRSAFPIDDEARTLFDLLTRVTASLARVFAGERKDILLPDNLTPLTPRGERP